MSTECLGENAGTDLGPDENVSTQHSIPPVPASVLGESLDVGPTVQSLLSENAGQHSCHDENAPSLLLCLLQGPIMLSWIPSVP